GYMPGGNIEVRVGFETAQSRMSIVVHDDGWGIPEGVRPWLLTPNPGTGRAAGVSLRIVHDIVAAHGGDMNIESSTRRRDHGTTVTLAIPSRSNASQALRRDVRRVA